MNTQKFISWIAFIMPVLPLLNGFASEPYGNPKINIGANSIPILEFFALISLIIMAFLSRVRIRSELLSTFLFTILILYSTAGINNVDNISLILLITLSYTMASIYWKDDYVFYRVNTFILSLLSISILVMFFRLAIYEFDFIRARSGANIYGANAVINLVVLYLSYRFLNKEPSSSDYIYLVLLTFFSFLFISKTGIIISIMLVIMYIICFIVKGVRGFIKGLVGLIILGFFLIITIFFTSIGDAVLFRFGFDRIIENGLYSTLEAMLTIQKEQQRGVLWSTAIAIAFENPFLGVGIGNFVQYGSQTSAHNLFLNNFAEHGLFFGMILNIIFLLPLYLVLKTRIPKSQKVYSIFTYSMFLTQALLAGQKMVQTTGYLSAFFLFIFFSLLLRLNTSNIRSEST